MTIDFRSLAKQNIRNLPIYQPGKPTEEVEREFGIFSSIKLASNENPLGASPTIISELQKALQNIHIYPDGECYEIKQALANFLAISPAKLTIGNGSENILELIVKAYLHDDNNAVISEYAFLTIPIILKSYGVVTKVVPALNWSHDIEGMIDAVNENTRVIFFVNPNNPTGTYLNDEKFRKILSAIPPKVLIVCDEAYAEYMTSDDYPKTQEYLSSHPNLIITRTFSKVYGLAGLRIGYAMSSPEIAEILNRTRLPFNVNSFAAKAACVALKDQWHVKESIRINQEGMQQITAELKKMNISFIPSVGNFVTIDVGDAEKIYQKLLQEGVIVRPLKAYNMHHHIRVTIGKPEQNQRFLQTLKKIL